MPGSIVAKHSIITDECRERGIDKIIAETLSRTEDAIRGALKGWPIGQGTEIHVKVEIVRE